ASCCSSARSPPSPNGSSEVGSRSRPSVLPPSRRYHQEPDMDTVNDTTAEHEALAEELASKGVEYAVGAFTDITGRSKSKIVPIAHLPNLLAGSERYTPRGMGDLGQMTPNEDECVAVPDISTLSVMP